MKIPFHRTLQVSLTLAVAGCSSGPSGEYGGDDCGLFDKLAFHDNGKVYISAKLFGMPMGETAGDYTVDGKKVLVTANNQTTVFTLNDDGDLEATLLGDKIVCRKGGGSGKDKSAGKAPKSLTAAYGGVACMFDKMDFSDDGKVTFFMDNEQHPGTYSMNGDEVTVQAQGGAVVFTLDGDNLEATVEGQKAVCSKL